MGFPRKIPLAQKVKWQADNGDGVAGISFSNEGNDTEDFIPWELLQPELNRELLTKLFANPQGYTFEVHDHHGKKNWVMIVVDSSENEICDVWFGGDPDNGWGFDGLIRVGNALAKEPPHVWQIYQRYSDGTYQRLPSRYGSLEKVPSTEKKKV
ncbi:MAG: hypothetical protein AAB407_00735 [Patescibacteria group bacterium]